MNAKIYNGNVQPNHKEYKIWVNNEGIIKTWNGTEWIEQSGGSGESGGSGNGSGESDEWMYLDMSNNSTTINIVSMYISSLIKAVNLDRLSILPASMMTQLTSPPLAIGVNMNLKVDLIERTTSGDDTHITSVKEYIDFLKSNGIDLTPYQITESEFYNLEA